ncbi:MAG TPA: L,D-transpeptidase [Chitinophagales bacterium]|nr:L,D-transpeptidase [Chitinophagales bacterium]
MVFIIIMSVLLPMQVSPPTISSIASSLAKKFAYKNDQRFLLVNIDRQEMYLVKNEVIEKSYRISSSKYGTGNQQGSGKTPLGVHRIAEKIGKNAKPNTIFAGRKDTGKIATIITDSLDIDTDDVTSRILWLEGLEPGINKGKGIDSRARYIYIHGTPEEGLIGTPASHGCIRMYNQDVIELFDWVNTGTLVVIEEKVNGINQ